MGNNILFQLYRVVNQNKVLFVLSLTAVIIGVTVSAPASLTGGLIAGGVYGLNRIGQQLLTLVSNYTSDNTSDHSQAENNTDAQVQAQVSNHLNPVPAVDPVESLLSRPVIQQARRPRSHAPFALSEERSKFIQQILDISASRDGNHLESEEKTESHNQNHLDSVIDELLNPAESYSRLLFQTNQNRDSESVGEFNHRKIPEDVANRCGFLRCSIM